MAIYQKLVDDNPAVNEFRLRLSYTVTTWVVCSRIQASWLSPKPSSAMR